MATASYLATANYEYSPADRASASPRASPRAAPATPRSTVGTPRSQARNSRAVQTPLSHPGSVPISLPSTCPPSRQPAYPAPPGSSSAGRRPPRAAAGDEGGELSWRDFKRSLDDRVAAPIRPELPSRGSQPASRTPTAPLRPRWGTPSAPRSPVSRLLFPANPDAARQTVVDRGATPWGTGQPCGMSASAEPGGLRKPNAVEQLGQVLDQRAAASASRGGTPRGAKAAGRASAVQLAERLARDAGPEGSPRSTQSRRLFGRCNDFTLPDLQDELLGLGEADVFPHRASVDEGLRELVEQVGSQCEERGLLVEYMRRHYVDAVQVAAELLRIMQGTLRVNKQLREATDERLLMSFQELLGETMRAMQPDGGGTALPPVVAPGSRTIV